MNTKVSPKLPNSISHKNAHSLRLFLILCLTSISLASTVVTVCAAINHPPFISWIADQRNLDSNGFQTKTVTIKDYDGDAFTISLQSSNTMFIPNGSITSYVNVIPCGGGSDPSCYQVTFPTLPPSDGATVITLATKQNNMVTAETSFALQLDRSGAKNPPSIQSLPNEAIQLPAQNGSAIYQTTFVVGDLNENGKEDIDNGSGGSNLMITKHSTNQALLLDSGIQTVLIVPDGYIVGQGPRSYSLTATTVPGSGGNPSPTGFTTVTVTVTDPDQPTPNSTTTSFVLHVIPAGTDHAPPTIGPNTSAGQTTYLLCPSPTPTQGPSPFQYVVTGRSGLNLNTDLVVTANSSNTVLVPNDHITVNPPDVLTGAGTIAIAPVFPLPAPGVPQTSTITMSAADDNYVRQSTFLYVAYPQTPVIASYSRPSGVYVLKPASTRQFDLFLTGEMHQISWKDLDQGGGVYDFSKINDAVSGVQPFGQDISLNLVDEPCYTADQATNKWCDTNASGCASEICINGNYRAAPWDSNLQTSRYNMLVKMAAYPLGTGHTVANEPLIPIINPNLPGGDTGIRDGSVPLYLIPGYSRPALLKAVQTELRNIQDLFPGKLVQFGFFITLDNLGPSSCTGSGCYPDELWQWLYRDAGTYAGDVDGAGVPLVPLADEFNGVRRPRVSFYQEDLAATRGQLVASAMQPTVPPTSSFVPNYITPANTTAYSYTPTICGMPTFAYFCSNPCNNLTCGGVIDSYRNGISFQANTPWVNPFEDANGQKLFKTLNGSPNDAMEGAFNGYFSQLLEIYEQDIDQAQPPSGAAATWDAALWKSELKSWHDYAQYLRNLAPIEAPAGLTVVRTNANDNLVSWYAVYGATSYTLQRLALTNPPGSWTNAGGCDPTLTSCRDTASTGTEYGYRVQAVGPHTSPWSYVGVFLSESTGTSNYDGYVELRNGVKTPRLNFVVQHLLGLKEALIGCFVAMSFSWSVVEVFGD